MKVAGLFAGIGGLELAFSQEGFETALLCEIDPGAQAVLHSHFLDVPLLPDVRQIEALPTDVQVLTAGFPCQNLSMAGDKKGLTGEKSSVVGHMFRLLERSAVETVVVENVNFMLSLDRGAAMRSLVEAFERLGFHWAYRVLDTLDFGLPQRRRRVYMVASRSIDPRAALFGDEVGVEQRTLPNMDRPIGFYWTEGRSGVGFTVDGVPPIKVGSAIGIASTPAVLFPDGQVLTPSLKACERLQGFAAGWTEAAHFEGGRRVAWRLVGNAVSVPVARWVARAVAASTSEGHHIPGKPLAPSASWPAAAWNVGDGRTACAVATRPRPHPRPSIVRFLDPEWEPLSDRALDGFISRAQIGGLRMPPGFLDALRRAERKVPRAHFPAVRSPSTRALDETLA